VFFIYYLLCILHEWEVAVGGEDGSNF